MNKERLKAVQAAWSLGLISTAKIVQIALEAVLGGVESLEFAALAGLSSGELDKADDMFRAALRSVGMVDMSKDEALEVYAHWISMEIVSGARTPSCGARDIWNAVLASGCKTHEYDTFVYAASEYDERPSDRALFDAAVLAEAVRLTGK